MATYNYSLQADPAGAIYSETSPVTAGSAGAFTYDVIPSTSPGRKSKLPLIQLMWQHPGAAVGGVEAGGRQWHSCTLQPTDNKNLGDGKTLGRLLPLIEVGTVWKVRFYGQGGGDGCMLTIEIN